MKNNLSKTFNRSLAAAAVFSVLGANMAFADDLVGDVTITGDSSGYKVKAVNVDTGQTRTVDLKADGSYRLAKMPSGTYTITVSKGNTVYAESKARSILGTNTVTNFEVADSNDTEVIQIVGSSVATIDITASDSGLVLGEVEIDRLPVARNITAVALLAPGVIRGDGNFGTNVASFGGSSPSENVCYINGMEVTDTRRGLGCGELPFEFYKEFQVKTGGYSARYGRATGGMVNATAKSGTNEWEFSATASLVPDSLRSEGRTSRGNGGTGKVFRSTENDTRDETDLTFSVGGPIIEDTLFMYAIVNARDYQSEFSFQPSNRQMYLPDDEWRTRDASGGDNMFWGATIDWDINDDHRLSYFGYSNESDTTEEIFAYDPTTNVIGERTGGQLRLRGGETHSIKYTGFITDDLIVSAQAGRIETQYETRPDDIVCADVADNRTNPATPAVGCGTGTTFGANLDENEQWSLDIEYTYGDHTINVGYENQTRFTQRVSQPAGGHAYTYISLADGSEIQGTSGVLYANNTGAEHDLVFDRIFAGGGEFESDISAFYIEDKWSVTDDLTVTIGLRRDEFSNVGTTGKTLTDFTTDVAPRLGFSWDPTGNGESKFYGTFGQYYLPVANNTVFRAASGVSDVTTYYTFDGINSADGTPTGISPVNGDAASSSIINGVGAVPGKDVFQAQEADPFSKVEYILGYETMLNDEYTLLVKGTYRYVDSALDDYCGSFAFPYCVLLNPGEDSSWFKDGVYWNGTSYDLADGITNPFADPRFDGTADPGSLTLHPNDTTIQLPKAKNQYYALETTIRYQLDDLAWSFSYTWSHSYGNFEGAVKSDTGQADAGITTDFDFPALLDGADGNLANDRRHVLKFFGSYNVTEDLVVGWNSSLLSGRPRNTFGAGHPNNDPNIFGSYGDTYYIQQADGTFIRTPRGSNGTTDWVLNVDLSATYHFEFNGVDMSASLDVFNVLDTQNIVRQNDHYEARRSPGTVNQWYGAAEQWQEPRSVRLGFSASF